MVLDVCLLNTQHNKVQIKSKWSNPGIEIVPSPTPWCSSYWKGSLHVTFDNNLYISICDILLCKFFPLSQIIYLLLSSTRCLPTRDICTAIFFWKKLSNKSSFWVMSNWITSMQVRYINYSYNYATKLQMLDICKSYVQS